MKLLSSGWNVLSTCLPVFVESVAKTLMSTYLLLVHCDAGQPDFEQGRRSLHARNRDIASLGRDNSVLSLNIDFKHRGTCWRRWRTARCF